MRAFAVTGDSHFDSGPNGRLDETVRIHDWMLKDWRERGVGLVLHGGDVFEGMGTTTSPERLAVAEFLQEAASFADVLVLRGNHDPLGDLPLFEKLASTHGAIVVAEEVKLVRFEEADVEVVCVPWPRKGLAMLEMIEKPAGEVLDVRAALQAMMRFYATQPRKCSRRVVLAHAMICGAETSTGQPLTGTDCEVSIDDLALCEPDEIFLSHVHKPQDWSFVTIGGIRGRAHYVGSPTRRDFGELEEKRYLLVEERQTALCVEPVPTPATKLLLLEASWDGAQLVYTTTGPLEGPALARLRVTIPDDQREAARLAIANYVAQCKLWQIDVVVEEVPVVKQRTRAPEIACAVSLEDKCAIAWRAKGVSVAEDRKPRVMALARDIDDDVRRNDPRERGRRGGGVRLRSVEGRGIGPFAGDFALNVDGLRGPIVAVHGVNGAGKSTLLETLVMLVYRETLTRDPLMQLATGKDSRLSGVFDACGRTWKVLHLVDAASEKQSSTIAGDDGSIGAPDAKVSQFSEFVAKEMPPLNVFTAAQFTAQGSSGFLGLGAAKRKELVQQALGIDGVELRAGVARERLKLAVKERDLLAARLEEILGRGGDAVAIEEELRLAVLHVEHCQKHVEYCDGEVTKLRALDDEVGAEWTKYREALAEHGRFVTTRDAKTKEVHALEEQLANARAAAERLPTYTELHQAHAEVQAALQQHGEAAANLRAEIKQFVAGHEAAVARAKEARDRRAKADRRVDELRAKRDAAAKLKTLAGDVERARTFEQEMLAVYNAAKAAITHLGNARLEFTRGRAGKLRDRHSEICASQIVPENARETFQRISRTAIDEDDVGLATQDPSREKRLLEDEQHAHAAWQYAATALKASEQAHARVAGMGDVDAELARAEQEAAEADAAAQQHEAATESVGTLRSLREKLSTEEKFVVDYSIAADQAMERLRPEALDTRDAARLPALKEAKEKADAELRGIAALTPEKPIEPGRAAPSPSLIEATARAASTGRTALSAAEKAVASIETRLAAARDAQRAATDIRAKHAGLVEMISDLTLLEQTFGRQGIQALEVEAAGPELSAIVNELLHECSGNRWTIKLVTTEPVKDDPERLKEVFGVKAIDSRTGKERDAGSLSGGERVTIGEAISLALTVFACQRNAADRPTLVRDESGAALDPENAKGYVAMLRRAAARVGADHVLLVSHTPEVWALADQRVRVGGGTITIE